MLGGQQAHLSVSLARTCGVGEARRRAARQAAPRCRLQRALACGGFPSARDLGALRCAHTVFAAVVERTGADTSRLKLVRDLLSSSRRSELDAPQYCQGGVAMGGLAGPTRVPTTGRGPSPISALHALAPFVCSPVAGRPCAHRGRRTHLSGRWVGVGKRRHQQVGALRSRRCWLHTAAMALCLAASQQRLGATTAQRLT